MSLRRLSIAHSDTSSLDVNPSSSPPPRRSCLSDPTKKKLKKNHVHFALPSEEDDHRDSNVEPEKKAKEKPFEEPSWCRTPQYHQEHRIRPVDKNRDPRETPLKRAARYIFEHRAYIEHERKKALARNKARQTNKKKEPSEASWDSVPWNQKCVFGPAAAQWSLQNPIESTTSLFASPLPSPAVQPDHFAQGAKISP